MHERGARPRCRGAGLALIVVAAFGLGGCAGDVRGLEPPAGAWPAPPPPGMAPKVAAPVARPVALAFPGVIAADPEAQRFHTLQRLVEEGLVPPADADQRRGANLGALLPYSAPPPGAGLARPAPLQDIANRIALLARASDGPAVARTGEIAFLMEGVLPLAPKMRGAPARIEPGALEIGRNRVAALSEIGLVRPEEHQREIEAIEQARQALANAPPPPPPPKKPMRKKPAGGGAEGAKPGDVPGGALPAPTGKGPVGLHLLSMASDSLTGKAVDALKKEFPELAAMEFKAVKTTIPELGTTYRLLAGPLPAAEAEQMCKALRGKGQSCAIAGY